MTDANDTEIGKRAFLQAVATLGGASLLGTGVVGTAAANHPEERDVEPFDIDDRIDLVESERDAARESLVSALAAYGQTHNTEYLSTVELYGQEFAPFLFTKGMPPETNENGVPYPEGLVAYDRKLQNYWKPILERGNLSESFEQGGQRLFIGAPAVHGVTHSGMDTWRGRMPPAPNPTGVRNAGEMIDLYVMEQFRDVPFVAYPNEPGGNGPRGSAKGHRRDPGKAHQRQSNGSIRGGSSVGWRAGLGFQRQYNGSIRGSIDALNDDLTTIENELGESWWHDTDRLFVEADTGNLDWGPYLSQYLLHDVRMWALPIEQQYLSYEAGVDYNGTRSDWLMTLAGRDETSAEINPNSPDSDESSYISTGRDLATIVNADPPYQEYLIAGLHLLENGSFADGLPYNARDDGSVFGYTSSGPAGFVDILARGARQALMAAFYQKYYVHFRCRPETYAGRLHAQRNDDREFGISDVLTNSAVLSGRDNDTDFLTTVYKEGSPVHPAYPSGHSVIAGACGTILKVMFENTDWEDDYYVPTPDGNSRETVPVPSGHNGTYQEIDKLMSNVGLARMFAGVHYYSDHYQGIKLGEQVAVGLLLDIFERAYTVGERFTATFSPFLEYDTEYDVSIDTLETLREQSTNR